MKFQLDYTYLKSKFVIELNVCVKQCRAINIFEPYTFKLCIF